MSLALGKRKREAKAPRSVKKVENDEDSDDAARALFRRAFEAKFKALAPEPVKSVVVDKEEAEEECDEDEEEEFAGSDWDGIASEEEEDEKESDRVQVVQYAEIVSRDADDIEVDQIRRKDFMSSKPPQTQHGPVKVIKPSKKPEKDDDGAEGDNLKNDLALQRLLKESHLLDPSASRQATLSVEGKSRLKALDMRLQDLGAKSSVLKQEKMPMAQRKSIISKRADREVSRRKDAAENGIILERAKSTKSNTKPPVRRQRGLGGPGIGKFQGGMLKLSSRDVKDIVGTKTTSRFGSKGRKKR